MLSGYFAPLPMNEIITFGSGYKISKGVETFCNSVAWYGATIIGMNNSDEIENCVLENDDLHMFNAKVLADEHNVDLNLSPYTLKVIFFYLYLKYYSRADNVFLCDFTDVYFQKGLFDNVKDCEVFGEGELIGKCPTNSTWLRLCYNEDILNLLRNKEIINGGAILGKRQNCIDLLKEMCLESAHVIGRIGNYRNIDQAILNKVVRFDEKRYIVGNYTKVLNMAHMDRQVNLQFDDKGISANGVYPSVIHQYDVNKVLEAHIYGKI